MPTAWAVARDLSPVRPETATWSRSGARSAGNSRTGTPRCRCHNRSFARGPACSPTWSSAWSPLRRLHTVRPEGRSAARIFPSSAGARGHLRADGCCGDQREGQGEREIVVQGVDFGAPDGGGKCEGGLEHGEVVADAGAGTCAEGDVLPAVAACGVFRGEAFRVEPQRIFPKVGVAVHRVNPDRAQRARLHEITVDLDVVGD